MPETATAVENESVQNQFKRTEPRLEYIPIDLIRESEVALRSVDRKQESFLQLQHSISMDGVLKPILVCENIVGSETFYGLVDGLQRYTAARDAGLKSIPAQIVDLDKATLMQAQIITNMHSVQTKPAQYSDQLRRILSGDPLLTMQDLAQKLSVSVKWLTDRLALNKLDENIQKMVDNDEIKLANAYRLASLPVEEQKDYLDRAITDKATEFAAVVSQRVKEIRDARREGREPRKQEFVAIERARTLVDLKHERQSMQNITLALEKAGADTPLAGATLALDWVLSMDDDSVVLQESKYNQKKKERLEAQERAKVERERRKTDAAAVKQAGLKEL